MSDARTDVQPYYQGQFLRVIGEISFLPAGEVVYCIVDLGHEFIVRSDKVYNGVCEFCYTTERKKDFKVYK